MRLINKIVLVLLLAGTALTLAGCSGDEKPTIEIVELLSFRETATVTYQLTDDDEVIASGSFMAKIYEDGEDEVIDSVSLDESDYDEVEIDFDGLEVGTEYEVIFTATYNEKSKTVLSVDLATSNIGSEEEPYEISTYEELVIAGKDPTGFHILMNDIDCEGEEMDPLYLSTSKKLTGGFDGGGYTIKNVSLSENNAYVGLFGVVGEGAYIKNLNVENITIDVARSSSIYVGGLIGKNEGDVTGVAVKNLSIVVEGTSTNNMYVGGLIGYNTESSLIDDCEIVTTAITETSSISYMSDESVVDDSNDDTTVDDTDVDGEDVTVEDEIEELTLTDEDKEPEVGKIKIIAPGTSYIGGFVGANQTDDTIPTIKNCSTDLDVEYIFYNDYSSSSSEFEFKINIGGFAGYNAGSIESCTASSNITYVSYMYKPEKLDGFSLRIGGFIGKNKVDVRSCTVSGSINVVCKVAFDISVGGFAGVNESYYETSFVNNISFDDIVAVGSTDATVYLAKDFGVNKSL